MKTQNYLCIDLRTEMLQSDIQTGETRNGTLIVDETGEHFTFKETRTRTNRTAGHLGHCPHPELHWRLLDRTKHGRATLNSRHVKVEFYIHHDEYQDGADLADILAREIETFGKQFCETNFKEEVSKCC